MGTEALRRAASLGNALEFIEALPNGFATAVEGNYPYRDTLYNAKPDSLLQIRVNEIENETRLSGGQWQRLALYVSSTYLWLTLSSYALLGSCRSRSRTFMRSRGVRLAMYDEPSAHLDPKAEFGKFLTNNRHDVFGYSHCALALFERLRAMKGERTMFFITQYVTFSIIALSWSTLCLTKYFLQSIWPSHQVRRSYIVYEKRYHRRARLARRTPRRGWRVRVAL